MRFWYIAAGAALLAGAAHAATYGDANNNGSIDIADVRAVMQVAAGLAPASTINAHMADVAPVSNYDTGNFGDGKITIADGLRIVRKVNGLSTAEWPAKSSYYQLEVGNTFTTRKYDSTGAPTGAPDLVSTVNATEQDVRSGVTYVVFPIRGSDGTSEQRITMQQLDTGGNPVPFTDSLGRAALGATKASFGSDVTTFDPPIVLLVFPFQDGTTWSGSTKVTISGSTVTATYNGVVNGPVTVDVPAGHFDNAYKVSISYSGGNIFASATGTDYYWFVPYLGPVQHGFTRTTNVFGTITTTTVNPDIKLVSANVHGVKYP